MNTTLPQRVSLIRRLAAILYDSLLLLSLLLIATILAVAANHGQRIESNPFFSLYIYIVAYTFFGWFWTHGGQTLGMRAWRIHLRSRSGEAISWFYAFIRFNGSIISWCCVGLGFLWVLIDKQNNSWHDYMSKSQLVFYPKEETK